MRYLFICLLFLTACTRENKNIAEAPPMSDSLTAHYHKLFFEIDYPTQDLEEWLNRKFDQVIVDKYIPRDDKDSVRLVVTKPKKIQLKIVGDSVNVLFPLDITVVADKEKKSGKVKERQVTGELNLHLNIKPDVNEHWDIVAKSVLKKHEWVRKPKLKVGNVELGIKFIVDHLLRKEVNTLTENLDKALEEKVNLKKGLIRPGLISKSPCPSSRKTVLYCTLRLIRSQ